MAPLEPRRKLSQACHAPFTSDPPASQLLEFCCLVSSLILVFLKGDTTRILKVGILMGL